jgi:uncharacterized RDD family membrane protein YckC
MGWVEMPDWVIALILGPLISGVVSVSLNRITQRSRPESFVVPRRREGRRYVVAVEPVTALEATAIESPQAGEAETAERRKEAEPVTGLEAIPIESPQAGEAETAERPKEAEPVTALEAIPIESPQAGEAETAERLKEMEASVRYAGFWRRFIAFWIDFVVVIVLVSTLFFVAGFVAGALGSYEEVDATLVTVISFLSLFVPYLYLALAWGLWGKTVGYKALGMRLLRKNFRTVSIARALARCLALTLAIFTVLGLLMIAFTEKKRGLPDYVTDTVVVRG